MTRSERPSETPAASARLRAARTEAFRSALLIVGALALLLGILQIAVGAASPATWTIPTAFTTVFFVWTAAGIVAWWRRPLSGTGGLLLVGAVAVFLGGARNLGLPAFDVLGTVFATATLAVTVHLLHAFPSGRLRGRFSVVTVVAGYVVALGFQAPLYLIPPDRGDLFVVASTVQTTLGIGVMVATGVFLVGRLRTAEPVHQRVLRPLYLYGILAVLAIPVSANVLPLLGADGLVVGGVQLLTLAGIPIAFLLGVLLGGFTSTVEADALSAWLSITGSERTAVGRALASSLGDDSLVVAYWSPEVQRFVDERGAEVAVREQVPPRLWEEVRVESRLVGAIGYDGRMIADPESVRRAGRVFAIALDRERLTAALIASNEALMTSRLRIVEAADRERTRIARDLHDGLQAQLVLLAVEAQQIARADGADEATAAAATALRRRIDAAAADLRAIVHAVLPSVLVERGLGAAVEDLVDRLAIPATLVSEVDDRTLPPSIAQSAYLVVAEAITNAVKHADARSLRVALTLDGDTLRIVVADDGRGGADLEGGTGLKGLADRVDALGGTLTIESPAGGGTEMRVGLPCGS